MRFDVACLALAAYLVMTVYTLIRLQVLGVMSLAYCGVGPTEIRALLVAGILLAWGQGAIFIETWFGAVGLYNLMVATAAILAVATVLVSALRDGRMLARSDTRPQPQLAAEVRAQRVTRFARASSGSIASGAAGAIPVRPVLAEQAQ
jgi:hypothetical protein